MKRFVAITLVAIFLISGISNLSWFISAAEFSGNSVINFEGEQTSFYQSNPVTDKNSVAGIKSVSGCGNVMHFKKLKVYRSGWSDNQITQWVGSFWIIDSTLSKPAMFSKGQELSVSFKMKKNTDIPETYFKNFRIAMIFNDDFNKNNIGSINNYIENNKIYNLATVDCKKDDDWNTYTSKVVVPYAGKAVFAIYGNEWPVDCDIYVDDVSISEYNTKKDGITFENEQESFYNSNPITDKNTVAGISSTEDHGNVMHIKKIKVYRDNWTDNSITQWPGAFILIDEKTNQPLTVNADTEYSISFEMKKNQDIPTTYFSEINIALVFDEQFNKNNMGSINTFIEGGKTSVIYKLDCKKDDDWVKYSTNFKALSSGNCAFMVYGEEWPVDCDIYIDNIKVQPSQEDNQCITFEGTQAVFYENNAITDQYAVVGIDAAENHGNVMHFKKIKVTRDGWDDNAITQWPGAFLIIDPAAGEPKTAVSGDVLEFSFEMKKNQNISTDFYNQIKVAVIFNSSFKKGNIGSINTFINDGKVVDIATVDCNADNDWQNYKTVITAPVSGQMAFVIYGEEWPVDCNIDVDNIIVKTADPNSEKSIILNNFDNNNGSKEVVVKIGDDIVSIEKPFVSGLHFDGWYLDSEYKKNAKGSVASVSALWAKWRSENDATINSYDESSVKYKIDTADGYKMTGRIINGKQESGYFGQYNVEVVNSDSEHLNSAHLTNAQAINWNWPALLKIYDSQSDNLDIFVPNHNAAYKVKMNIKVDKVPTKKLLLQMRRLGKQDSTAYNEENIYTMSTVELDSVTDGWIEAETTFYTGENVSGMAFVLCSCDIGYAENVSVWIDNIRIEELSDSPSIYFDTVGGLPMETKTCIPGQSIPTFSVPKKNGNLFDGWYYDAEYTEPFCACKMPDKSIKLYAKWAEPITDCVLLDEKFENCSYANNGDRAGISDNFMSDNVTWINNSEDAFEGKGYISIKTPGLESQTEEKYPAVAFRNSDGSSYQIAKNAHYKISFAMRVNSASHYIYFITSQQVPSCNINLMNSTKFAEQGFSPLLVNASVGQWDTYEIYVIPDTSGKLYIIPVGSDAGTIDIDNLRIEQVGEEIATCVNYYSDGKLLNTQFGKIGSLLRDAGISNKEGLVFDGWRDTNNKVFLPSTFPDKSIDLHASWREATDFSKAKTDFSNDIVIDFEDAEGAKKFYGAANNSTEPYTGTIYVTGDAENAHSGDSYFKLYRVGMWTKAWYRKFRLYDKNSVGNQIYLDPLSVYKVSYWLNLERAGSGAITLAAFSSKENMNEYETDFMNYLTDAEQISNMGKWVKYEGTISTGEDITSLGFVMSGGWITAAIDDITVTKLREVTVSFDSNGGSAVQQKKTLSDNCVVEPEYPTKEGFTFAGWYADKEFTQLFKFTKTKVTTNITLYAKWDKVFTPQTVYKDDISYSTVEKTIEKPIEDAHLDKQITIGSEYKDAQANEVIKEKVDKEEKSKNWIVIPIVFILAIICGSIIFIIIKKMNRKEV